MLMFMSVSPPFLSVMIKSYGIALVIPFVVTGINAISDINYAGPSADTAYILKFHFLSALVYAFPISGLVYLVLRKPHYDERKNIAKQLVYYLILIILGGVSGVFTAFLFVPDSAGLDGIFPAMFAIFFGSIFLPLSVYIYHRYANREV